MTIGLLVALVLAGAAIAFVLVGEGDGEQDLVVTQTTTTEADADEDVSQLAPMRPERPSTQVYSPSDPEYFYVARLPRDGWTEPVESFPTGGLLLRTSLRGPGGELLIIDRTPGEEPQLGGGFETSRVVPHPEFGTATEYIFRDSDFIPECADTVCVDYLINDGMGGGWGVLAGGPDLATAQDVAEDVMKSVSLKPQ